VKSVLIAIMFLAATSLPSGAGWNTGHLWSLAVPGVSVPYFQHECTKNSRPPYYFTYANVRPGQIWGSNIVTCYSQSYSGPR
jgi:hypothetical protein